MLEVNETNTPFPLKVRGLRFEKGHRTLVKDLNFEIDQGGITAIMGPNGAGKSLTLRLLHGLIPPSNGTICWGNLNEKEARARQAMVFQKPVLLRRTVEANLAYALSIKGRPSAASPGTLIIKTLERAGLKKRARTPARALSGGEQQRLAIARALMHKPDILFLDEPTSSLDPSAVKAVEDMIRRAHADGTKIILVTHDLGQAKRLVDEVLFFNRGRLVEQGPATKMLTNPESKAARQFINGEIVSPSEKP